MIFHRLWLFFQYFPGPDSEPHFHPQSLELSKPISSVGKNALEKPWVANYEEIKTGPSRVKEKSVGGVDN